MISSSQVKESLKSITQSNELRERVPHLIGRVQSYDDPAGYLQSRIDENSKIIDAWLALGSVSDYGIEVCENLTRLNLAYAEALNQLDQ